MKKKYTKLSSFYIKITFCIIHLGTLFFFRRNIHTKHHLATRVTRDARSVRTCEPSDKTRDTI